MKINILLGVLLVLLFAGTVYCDNGAALQISGHSTIPDTIYAGTAGQLQLTILNSGTDTAGQVGIDYSTPSQTSNSRIFIGDIGPGTSAIASVPFNVPQNVGSGFFTININVVYFGDSAHTEVKNTPVTIPVIVAQHQVLAVNTVSVAPQVIQPGDKVTAVLEITNTGGVMNDIEISTPQTSSFNLEGSSQQAVGSIPPKGNATVSVTIGSSSSTPIGKYTIPLIISYRDSLQNTMNQTIAIGPVTVTDSSAQFRIHMTPLTNAEVGSEAQFALNLENLGGSGASPIVDLNQTSQFTPIGSTRIYFDDIEPGTNQTKIVTLGIGASISAGYYSLPMEVTCNGMTFEQDIGIVVNATPNLVVTTETTPAYVSSGSNGVKVLAQISNTGDSSIRSVYVSTAPPKGIDITGATDKFIGTLNVDDFATFQITIDVPPGTQAGKYVLPLKISFKDGKNMEHTLVRDVTVNVYSSQDAMKLNSASGSTSSTTGTYSGTRQNAGGILGLGLIPSIAGGLAVLGVAYFGYKKLKGNKK